MTFSSSDGFGFVGMAAGSSGGTSPRAPSRAGLSSLQPSRPTREQPSRLLPAGSICLSSRRRDQCNHLGEGHPADDTTFKQVLATRSSQFTSVIDTAYTLSFVSTNLTGVQSASLNLSAGTPWVQEYGGGNNITVIRHGDNGIDEVLNPTATFTDTAKSLDFFTIPSPHGLSRFALVSATGSSNLIQMGTRLATQLIQSSGSGHSSNDYQGTWENAPGRPQPAG